MKKVVTLSIAAMAALTLAACGSSSSSDKDSSSSAAKSSTVKKTESSKKTVDEGKMTVDQYKAIKIGDAMSKGQGGITKDAMIKQWGQPTATSSSTIQDMKTEMLTWNKVANGSIAANFSVQFIDGNAVQKAITGLKVDRSKKIKLADFDAVQTGAKQEDVIKQFGEPNGYAENVLNGMTTVITTYNSGIDGDMGANCVFTFQGGALTTKTQLNMK